MKPRRGRRARHVHLDRAALRSAESRALDEHRPRVVEPHRAHVHGCFAPFRCAGARSVLRHRRHDLCAASRHEGRASKIIGADFSHAMLVRAEQKIRQDADSLGRSRRAESAVRRRPVSSGHLGVRLSQPGELRSRAGQRFIACWRRAARSASWTSASPKGLIGKLYRVYFRRVLPAIGTLISGVSGPYAYLPASVSRFPSPEEMLRTHARRRLPRMFHGRRIRLGSRDYIAGRK